MKTFSDLGLNPALVDAVTQMGFESPTEIQEKAIPQLIDGDRDMMALSQTGTGKTAAFGLPMLHNMADDAGAHKPQALILSPTRELCVQIGGELEKYAANLPKLRIMTAYGGSSVRDQIRDLKRGIDIVVATPGRLIDLIERKAMDLSEVTTVVLDESDEMLNMGFLDDVRGILQRVHELANTWLFSATFPKEIERIIKDFMDDPIKVQVGSRNEATSQVDHKAFVTHRDRRYAGLRRLLDSAPQYYGMIFCPTKVETRELSEKLIGDGYTSAALHGDLSQQQRDLVMHAFRSRQIRILVCTDVAARGIDVQDISHVIHFRMPKDKEAYTHRSGRTGRAGKTGESWALLTPAEFNKIPMLERQIGRKIPKVEFPSRQDVVVGQLRSFAERVVTMNEGRDVIKPHIEEIMNLFEGMPAEEMVERFLAAEFESLFRHYAEHVDLDLNLPDRKPRRERSGEGGERDNHRKGGRDHEQRFWINLGSKHGFSWPLLKDFVREAAQLGDYDVQGVNIGPAHGYFTVPAKAVDQVRKELEGARWEGVQIKLDAVEHHVGRESRRRDENGSRVRNRGGKPGGGRPYKGGGRSYGGGSRGGGRSHGGGGGRGPNKGSRGNYRG